jgi:hypothetical protein
MVVQIVGNNQLVIREANATIYSTCIGVKYVENPYIIGKLQYIVISITIDVIAGPLSGKLGSYLMGFVQENVLGYQFVHRNKTFWFLHRMMTMSLSQFTIR